MALLGAGACCYRHVASRAASRTSPLFVLPRAGHALLGGLLPKDVIRPTGSRSYSGSATVARRDSREHLDFSQAPPPPTGEAAQLLDELAQGTEEVDPSDYWVYGAWDLEGLRSDVEILREDGRGAATRWQLPERLAAFEKTLASQWLPGTVTRATSSALNVNLPQPGGGPLAQGTVDVAAVPHVAGDLRKHFALGQEVKVRVVGYNQERNRLILSLSGAAADIKRDLEAQLAALEARVAADPSLQDLAADSGAASPTRPAAAAAGAAAVNGQRIALSDPLPASQDVGAFAGLPSAQWLSGVVHHTASFGAYILLDDPRGAEQTCWGLLHLTEMPSGAPAPAAGATVQVRVARADVQRGQLALSMKPADA
eukprot:TRINITY_DN121200_c0_g1_i1.p1 TRINITY_DN121200_c0_g1~~TRINITY_DN121200_c0_g1_i1.p1  ORF type:complete len:408 (-),score=94.62 TRINITY_DN121200_c0_g1_i1:72-1181(-)